MFSIGQNLNLVHMTYSFLELLIFFWLTQVDIYCLEFISHHIKEILYLNINSKGNQPSNKHKHFHDLFLSRNKNKHFHLFLLYKYKNSLWTIFFLSFMNTFSEAAARTGKELVLRLRQWIPNLGVPCSIPLDGCKVDSASHPSEVDKMSTRNFWELSGKK